MVATSLFARGLGRPMSDNSPHEEAVSDFEVIYWLSDTQLAWKRFKTYLEKRKRASRLLSSLNTYFKLLKALREKDDNDEHSEAGVEKAAGGTPAHTSRRR